MLLVTPPAASSDALAGNRVADAVLLHRAVRDGRRARGDRRDRRGRRRHRLAHRRRPHRRAARHHLGVGDRLRRRRQHPVHRGDDPGRRAAQGDGGDDAYWWALALGACFGGNATLVAAAANVAAAGMAARAGRPIGFVAFLRIGLPVTLVMLSSPPPTSPSGTCDEPPQRHRPAHPRQPGPQRRRLGRDARSAACSTPTSPRCPSSSRRPIRAASSASASSSRRCSRATSASSSPPAS